MSVDCSQPVLHLQWSDPRRVKVSHKPLPPKDKAAKKQKFIPRPPNTPPPPHALKWAKQKVNYPIKSLKPQIVAKKALEPKREPASPKKHLLWAIPKAFKPRDLPSKDLKGKAKPLPKGKGRIQELASKFNPVVMHYKTQQPASIQRRYATVKKP